MQTSLSRPVRLMLRHRLLSPRDSFFDYGCGAGDDIRILRRLGIAGAGWDPTDGPRPPLAPANVVNLGYVLNVISDASERRRTLHTAWGMTARLLAVTVPVNFRHRPQPEWQDFIDEVLDVASVTAGAGVYYLFRDAGERDAFLAHRPDSVAPRGRTDGRTPGRRRSLADRLRRTLGRRRMLRETGTAGLVTFGVVAGTVSIASSQTVEPTQRSGRGAADVAARIRRIVAEHLGVEESRVTDSAYLVDDLAADSLDTVEIAMALEEEFDCEISDEALERILTVKDAIDFIMRACRTGAY